MKHNVLEIKNRLRGKVDGSSLSGARVYNTIVEALINMKSNIPLEGARRETQLVNPFFNHVNEYVLPLDFEELIDVRLKDSGKSLIMQYEMGPAVRANRSEPLYNVRTRNGVQVLNFNFQADNVSSLMYDLNDIGTVNALSVNNLTTEFSNTLSGSAIKFDLPLDNTKASLEINGVKDISFQGDEASVFVNVYIPDKKYIDSFELDITDGTNTQNLKSFLTQSANEFEKGWNLIRFQLDKNKAELELDNIQNVVFSVTYNSVGDTLDTDIDGIIIDEVVAHKGAEVVIEYYSNYIFNNNDDGIIPRPKDDSDYIMLTDIEFNILTYETGLILAQESQGSSSAKTILEFEKKLYGGTSGGRRMVGLYSNHNVKHPHEQKLKNSTNYNVPTISKKAGTRRRVITR